MTATELRMYKYRLYPSRKQREHLFNNFDACKEIYNNLLEISIKTYNETGKTLKKYDFDKLLTGKHPKLHSQVKQNISDRVHKAFQNFFRRTKDPSCKEKGFPRFKSRINSITYPQSGFKFISQKRLKVSKIGTIPIILHRVPKGKLKTFTIKRNNAGQWYAILGCEINIKPVQHQSTKKVGIDVGIEHFATFSNGKTIENPRYLIKSEKRLRRLQRNFSRKQKKSRNRTRARFRVAKQHIKIVNQRLDFLHKVSTIITKQYSFIAVENLNIRGMVRNHHLARHISDASWNSFFQMLSYKAVASGGQLVNVNARNTSRKCSRCRTIADMPLHIRQFKCPNCGLVLHRDHNAAINIFHVGQDLPESTPADRPASAPSLDGVSELDETGTKWDNT